LPDDAEAEECWLVGLRDRALMPEASRIIPDCPKVRCQSLTMNARTKAISPKSKKSSMSPIVAAKAIFHWSGSRAEALDQRLTDRRLSSPEEAEGGGGSPTEMP
jgi:hypothetical protein